MELICLSDDEFMAFKINGSMEDSLIKRLSYGSQITLDSGHVTSKDTIFDVESDALNIVNVQNHKSPEHLFHKEHKKGDHDVSFSDTVREYLENESNLTSLDWNVLDDLILEDVFKDIDENRNSDTSPSRHSLEDSYLFERFSSKNADSDTSILTDDDRLSVYGILTGRIMTQTEDEGDGTRLETDFQVTPRVTPMIHPAVDPPACAACLKLDMSFCDPQCAGCKDVISNMDVTIPELFAVIRQWTSQTQQNIFTLVNEVMKRGANVNDRDGLTDMTVLHYAAKAGAHGIGDSKAASKAVSNLIEKGADVFIRCRWTNMTALHYAAYFDVPEVIRILLKASHGVDIDSTCSEFDHGTPLHIAAINMAQEAAKCLVQNGANLGAKDCHGRTALECIPDESNYEKTSDMGKIVASMRKMLSDAEPAQPKKPPPNYDLVPSKVTLQSVGVKLGDRVIVGGIKGGTLRYCGPTEFAAGIWAGIELDEPIGKNDGSVGNISYFTCPKNRGIFAPFNKIAKEGAVTFGKHGRSRSTTPTALRTISHPKVDVSRVTARINTGLRGSSSVASECGELEIGDRVLVAGQRKGTIRFSGETQFALGHWYGIELDRSVGKNDGCVNGVRYFTCRSRRGVFAPLSRLRLILPGYLIGSNESLNSNVSLDSPNGQERRLSGVHARANRSSSLSSLNLSFSSTTCKTPEDSSRPRSSGSLPRQNNQLSTSDSGVHKLQIGLTCFCNNELGVIRYIGPTDFAEGLWLGVELRTPKGKNDGNVQGIRYFTCKPNHGLLVRPSKISVRGINGAKLVGDLQTKEKEIIV